MSKWLGVAVLVLFSIALSLLMRLERKPKLALPEQLRHWTRVESKTHGSDEYLERRVVELESRGFCGVRWVEQQRVRRTSDDAIVEVLPERPFRLR